MKKQKGMDFSKALKELKAGKRLTRLGWHNELIWIEAQFPDKKSKMTKPYISMWKMGERFPCDLSCESIFGDDWIVLANV